MKKIIIFFLYIFLASCTITSQVIKDPYSNIEVYFCPEDQCLEKIINLIDSSTDIKCAFFDLDLPELIEKLKQKNADVIIEDKNKIDGFHSGYSSALMHNKFCVFDNLKILTGSMNPTERGNYYNNNNIMITESKSLADNYLEEFEELKNGIYGKGKKVKNPILFIGNTKVNNYFCPEDNCKLHVVEALQEATKSIYFMTYSFTDKDIGNLLWNKDYLGIEVKGVFEKKQLSDYSRYDDLKDFSIIDKNKYTMHHKVFIIDNKTVITGSFNPSKNANENNDENILIINDEKIAKKFVEEFENLYYFKESFPKKTKEIILKEILYDAIGSDKDSEFINIKNIGTNEINLNYYFLSNNKTNYRLNGIIKPNESTIIKPSFSLKNSNGILILKKNHKIIDYVYWEGFWDLKANEGQILKRTNEESINKKSWIIVSNH